MRPHLVTGTVTITKRGRPRSAVLEHGTVRGYNYHACRCPQCRAAWMQYKLKWRQARREKQTVIEL